MTGTEKITQRILQQAQQQVAEIEAQANAQAQSVMERQRSQAERQAAQMIAQAETQSQERRQRVLAVADLELRKKTLSAKREVLDAAFERAQQMLCDMQDEAYTALYQTLVLQAVQTGDAGIRPSKAEAQRLGEGFVQQLNEQLTHRGLPAHIQLLPVHPTLVSGCMVVRGDMEVDLSAPAVLRNLREQAEGEIAQMLFAKEG